MAGSSLLALIDDISSVLDDVATLTKVATHKTAGVLGDDLALNAEQVSGVNPDRELPVVWAVAKGSVVNKAILVPSALALSALSGTLVSSLLLMGGIYLCFEGFEKVLERFFPGSHTTHPKSVASSSEAEKIKGAIRTDFVLSAEIIVITLGTLIGRTLGEQLATLVAVSVVMTVGVYGLVAGIVKLDDWGLWLCRTGRSRHAQMLGRGVLLFAPRLMKSLGVIGTIAMFLVGGGIVAHLLPADWIHGNAMPEFVMNFGFGVLTGAAAVALWAVIQRVRRAVRATRGVTTPK